MRLGLEAAIFSIVFSFHYRAIMMKQDKAHQEK